MKTAFGLPLDTPAFGYMRILGFAGALVGAILWLNDGDPATANTLFWAGIVVGFIGIYLTHQQRRAQEFNDQLDAYVAGDSDDLPK